MTFKQKSLSSYKMAECDRAEYEWSSAQEGGDRCPRRQERRGGDSRTRCNSTCRREGQRGRWVHAYRRERSKETREQKPDFKTLSTPPLPTLPNLLSPPSLEYGHSLPAWFSPSILSFSHLNTEEGVKPAHLITPVLAQSLWRLHTPPPPQLTGELRWPGRPPATRSTPAHPSLGGPSSPLRFSWGSRHSCPVFPSSSSPPELPGYLSLVTWDWAGIIPEKNSPRNPACQQCLVPRSQRPSLHRSGELKDPLVG